MNALSIERKNYLELVSEQSKKDPFVLHKSNKAIGVPDKVIDEAREILSKHFEDEQFRYSLSLRWMPGSLVQKSERDIVSVSLASEIDRYTNFEVVYRHGNRLEKAEVQIAVDLEKSVPVASKRIMHGETIKSEDIHYDWVSISTNSDNLIDSKNLLVGKTLRRTLAAGQPVRHTEITSEIVISAGDDVKLLYEENGILISVTVQSRQDGEIDELITLYSDKTRTRYLGRVINQGVAKWEKTL